MVTAQHGNKQVTRNSSKFKRVPEEFPDKDIDDELSDTSDDVVAESPNDSGEAPQEQTTPSPPVIPRAHGGALQGTESRPQRTMRPPTYLKDYVSK